MDVHTAAWFSFLLQHGLVWAPKGTGVRPAVGLAQDRRAGLVLTDQLVLLHLPVLARFYQPSRLLPSTRVALQVPVTLPIIAKMVLSPDLAMTYVFCF